VNPPNAPRPDSPKGILNPQPQLYQLSRYTPSPDLAHFVQRYWVVRWSVDAPHLQENIPHPCVNLVFEHGRSGIFGVAQAKSARLLEGTGMAFGVKFRPGAFYPFFKAPLSTLTNRMIPISTVFDAQAAAQTEAAVLPAPTDLDSVSLTEAFLRSHLPPPDANVLHVNQIIDCIIEDRSITQVDHLAARFAIHKRALQRLFSQYVGVSPKWVIQRYRLHEAAEQIATGSISPAALALELGYFDQSHFIRDFKAIVGQSPMQYADALHEGVCEA
jgi:AraC-like DNA-binding protein